MGREKCVREVAGPVFAGLDCFVELEDCDTVDSELEWERCNDPVDDSFQAVKGVRLVAAVLSGLS